MHKVLAIILSLFVAVSTLQPCSDSLSCSSDKAVTECVDRHDHCHKQDTDVPFNNNGNGDDCSPFCVCACCHAPVLLSATAYPLPPQAVLTATIPEYKDDHTLEFVPLIWQPPRS